MSFNRINMLLHFRHTHIQRNITMRTVILFGIVLLCSSLTHAGNIFGTILGEDKKLVAKGIKVEVTTPKATYTASTDDHGRYSVFIKEAGKFTLKLYYNGQILPTEIRSFSTPTQYNLAVEKIQGKYSLKK